ncbi:carbohydrate sulfotransferase 1-like [Ptychodera flava]|uniref:carbohydrate sulfotransferase 1-like n=1 Tax=Ptychodera flava TaxID=63121 RepID=UPI003969C9D2
MKFHHRLTFVTALLLLFILLLSSPLKDFYEDRSNYADKTTYRRWIRRPFGSEKQALLMAHETSPYDIKNESVQDKMVAMPTTPLEKHIHILVHARMRTGSSVTGSLFNNLPDFFYVYEPGHMIVEDKQLDLYADSFKYLETIRPDLVSFLRSIYNCSFGGKTFYTRSLQRHHFMRQNSKALAGVKTPIREGDLERICSQKKHIVVKTVRLNNVVLAEAALRENNVRVIHVVRDPRAMMLSRRNMQHLSGTERNNRASRGVFEYRLEKIIKDYCKWLEDNYISVEQGSEWMKNQYLLIRYEDLIDRPVPFVAKMFKFAGLPLDNDTVARIQSADWWRGHGEEWRSHVTFKEVARVHKLCPDSVFRRFGYKKLLNESQLTDNSTSVVLPLEYTDLNPQLV